MLHYHTSLSYFIGMLLCYVVMLHCRSLSCFIIILMFSNESVVMLHHPTSLSYFIGMLLCCAVMLHCRALSCFIVILIFSNESVVLGGTSDMSWDLVPSTKTHQQIFEGTQKLIPSLKVSNRFDVCRKCASAHGAHYNASDFGPFCSYSLSLATLGMPFF